MRKQIGLAAIGAISFAVAILFAFGGVKLTDFFTQLAVGLTLLIPVIAAFTFKPEIDAWTTSRRKRAESVVLPLKTTVEIQVVEKKDKEEQITSHRNGLMTKFIDFAYTDFRKGGKVSERPIELFPHHKELKNQERQPK